MARYDKRRKLDRNAKIVKFRADNPELSLEEIGQFFGGISRQRVSQICEAAKKRGG